MVLLFAYVAGLLLARLSWLPTYFIGGLAVLLLTGALLRRMTALLVGSLLALTLVLGIVRGRDAAAPKAAGVAQYVPALATVSGRVVSDVELPPTGSHAAEPMARCLVQVSRISVGESPVTYRTTGLVQAELALRSNYSAVDVPQFGDIVRARGLLQFPRSLLNPGGFNEGAYLNARGVTCELLAKHADDWEIRPSTALIALPERLLFAARRFLTIRARGLLPADDAALLEAQILGERGSLSIALKDAFTRTGASHLLATGGLQVGLLLLVLPVIWRQMGVPYRASVLLTLTLVLAFSVFAGGRPSIDRAAFTASIALFGIFVQREPDWPTALAASAFCLLLFTPGDLFDVGFQLTFSVVVVMAALLPTVFSALQYYAFTVWPGRKWSPVRRLFIVGTETASVAAAAQIGVAPMTAVWFHTLTPLATLNSMILLLPAFGAIAISIPALLVPAAPLVGALRSMLDTERHLAQVLAHPTWVVLSQRTPPVWLLTIVYSVILVAAILLSRARFKPSQEPRRQNGRDCQRPAKVLLTFAALAVSIPICLQVANYLPTTYSGRLLVTFLDVGQGDASVIQLPDHRTILIDTGPINHETGDDAGRRVVLPFLRSQGIQRIDAIILTHPHSDHIGGAATLVNQIPVGQVLDNGQDTGTQEEQDYRNACNQRHVPDFAAHAGEQLNEGGRVNATIFAPTSAEVNGTPNNASVVLRVVYGHTSFLFMGDAEAPEEQDLLASGYPLSSTVLKVGHHGSDTSTTSAFLRAVRPIAAVISVGLDNVYGHPSPEVVIRLKASVPYVYRTDVDGAVQCLSNGSKVVITQTAPIPTTVSVGG